MTPLLRIRQLEVSLGGSPILHGIDLDLGEGEVLIIVGSSGCGKTTLLRAIAGLERPTQGSIEIDGAAISDPRMFIAPQERPIGMVFQGLALFPHLTVAQNVGFGLNKVVRSERDKRVAAELKSVGLEGLERRYPHQLSGGQQQRVAIARSLILRPRVLLMDEPFSDLDSATRAEVRAEVFRILHDHGTAAIIVSHDKEDAYHLGDRIAVMDKGRIVRIDRATLLRKEWADHPFAP
ncbi:MAG: ABC transporter ATP-binding protein [Flavobacteriales bacterium]|nr:ABC transporter ATP-binding protein [Flavobacteriales bacterium]